MAHVVFCLLKAIILMMNLYLWDENMHIGFIKYSIKIGPQSSVTHTARCGGEFMLDCRNIWI